MTDISKHPILKQCYELSLAIEKFDASTHQTDTSTLCSELNNSIEILLDQIQESRREGFNEGVEAAKEAMMRGDGVIKRDTTVTGMSSKLKQD